VELAVKVDVIVRVCGRARASVRAQEQGYGRQGEQSATEFKGEAAVRRGGLLLQLLERNNVLIVINETLSRICGHVEEGRGMGLPALAEGGCRLRGADGAVDDVVGETHEIGEEVRGDGGVRDAAAAVDCDGNGEAGVGLVGGGGGVVAGDWEEGGEEAKVVGEEWDVKARKVGGRRALLEQLKQGGASGGQPAIDISDVDMEFASGGRGVERFVGYCIVDVGGGRVIDGDGEEGKRGS
jgi:hypothetical protein